MNDPDWIRFIGDRNVHTLGDAENYLRNGPLAMLERHGVGLCRVDRREDGSSLGMCGLIRRDGLDDVDLGFAFLAEARGHGYATEAARAVLDYGLDELRLPRIVAITDVDNHASARVLERLGMRCTGSTVLPGETTVLRVYAIERVIPGS